MADVDSRQRARRIVQERGLTGLANDTKWGEFLSRFFQIRMSWEVKLLNEDQPRVTDLVFSPSQNYIEGLNLGPELYVFIEWMRSPKVKPLVEAAAVVGLECVVQDGQATVYGYR